MGFAESSEYYPSPVPSGYNTYICGGIPITSGYYTTPGTVDYTASYGSYFAFVSHGSTDSCGLAANGNTGIVSVIIGLDNNAGYAVYGGSNVAPFERGSISYTVSQANSFVVIVGVSEEDIGWGGYNLGIVPPSGCSLVTVGALESLGYGNGYGSSLYICIGQAPGTYNVITTYGTGTIIPVAIGVYVFPP
jgi:hypothetical protein